MTSYLLDTNIISDLIRNPQGRVFEKIRAIGETNIATNVVVAAELRYGAEKKGFPALVQRIDEILSRFAISALEQGMDETYGRIRTDLERRGAPIGANDLLIAAHVSHLSESGGWVLVTTNEKEFRRVNGLSIENWLSTEDK